MSLHPQAIGPVPEETARVARAVFRKGNLYLRIRDELGTIYDDPLFAALFPNVGQPALAPWRFLSGRCGGHTFGIIPKHRRKRTSGEGKSRPVAAPTRRGSRSKVIVGGKP